MKNKWSPRVQENSQDLIFRTESLVLRFEENLYSKYVYVSQGNQAVKPTSLNDTELWEAISRAKVS